MIDFHALRERVPLTEFLTARGVELRRCGNAGEFTGLCPLHDERTPSFHIYPDGYCHCYGCGFHGDVVDLCAALDRIPLAEAVEKLGGAEPTPIAHREDFFAKPKAKPYQLTDEDINRMAKSAHRLATDGDLIARLVAERPEWTAEAIRGAAFDGDLGIEAGRMLFGYRFGIKARWKDSQGNRVIRWICGAPNGECWRQSLLLRSTRRVYIVEGETDCLTFLSGGGEHSGQSLAVALSCADIMPNPLPFSGKEIVIVPDPDEAGEKSAQKLRELLRPVSRSIAIVNLEEVHNG